MSNGLRQRCEMLIPPLPWDRPAYHGSRGEKVVLLHGLWRGFHAMSPLARELRKAGFSTLNIPYPSMLRPIDKLAARVREQVARFAGGETVHFVTHSLGGIVARCVLTEPVPWKCGRLVMLAVPNQGCEIVNWASRRRIVHALLGPAGRCLGRDGAVRRLPPLPPGIEAAVVMGKRSAIPLFRHLLPGENDGIVSVESGRMEGLRGFTVIDADHTFIQCHPETVRRCTGFFKTGVWPD
jgi:triacylglycerol lipase